MFVLVRIDDDNSYESQTFTTIVAVSSSKESLIAILPDTAQKNSRIDDHYDIPEDDTGMSCWYEIQDVPVV